MTRQRETDPQQSDMENEQNAEERIFNAARDVFFEQGFDGARMQEIARRAGINQSMLHYYYRTKDKLFDAVFQFAARQALGKVFAVLDADMPLLDKIERFVDTYIDMISTNPHIPAFILQELRRNPDRLHSFVASNAREHLSVLQGQIAEAVEQGQISPIRPEHLIANLFALSVFPFIARPMLQAAIGLSKEEYDELLNERKTEVTRFVLNGLRP